MTDRNEESLSTRDLASPTDSQGAATTTVPDSEGLTEERAGRGTAPSADMPVEPADVASDAGNAQPHDVAAESGAVGLPTRRVRQPPRQGRRCSRARRPSAGGSARHRRRPRTGAVRRRARLGGSNQRAAASRRADGGFPAPLEEVQTRFVDEPRGAVEQADGLVWPKLMQQLAESFAQERERLEAQWGTRRGHLDRGPAGCVAALPLVLPAAAVDVVRASRVAGPHGPATRVSGGGLP